MGRERAEWEKARTLGRRKRTFSFFVALALATEDN